MNKLVTIILFLIIVSCNKKSTTNQTSSVNQINANTNFIEIDGDKRYLIKNVKRVGFQSSSIIGWRLTLEIDSINNVSNFNNNKIYFNIRVYDSNVNPYAVNSFKSKYPITLYDTTASSNTILDKAGINIVLLSNEIVTGNISSFSNSIDTLFCSYIDKTNCLELKNSHINGHIVNAKINW